MSNLTGALGEGALVNEFGSVQQNDSGFNRFSQENLIVILLDLRRTR